MDNIPRSGDPSLRCNVGGGDRDDEGDREDDLVSCARGDGVTDLGDLHLYEVTFAVLSDNPADDLIVARGEDSSGGVRLKPDDVRNGDDNGEPGDRLGGNGD